MSAVINLASHNVGRLTNRWQLIVISLTMYIDIRGLTSLGHLIALANFKTVKMNAAFQQISGLVF